VRDEAALAGAIYIEYELPPTADGRRRSVHDVFPSIQKPGTVWLAGISTGSILAVDTKTLDFAARTKEWPIPHPTAATSGIASR